MVFPEPKHPHLCETVTSLLRQAGRQASLCGWAESLEDMCYRSIVDAIFKTPALICTFEKTSLRN